MAEFRQAIELLRRKLGLGVEVRKRLAMAHQEDAHGVLGHGAEIGGRGGGRSGEQQGKDHGRNLSRFERAACAACQPHMPWTPPPGGVEDEHRYRPGIGVAYGFHDSVGRANSCARSCDPAADRAADVVRVVAFEIGRGHRCARQDEVAEAGREALELRLDARGHVDAGAARHVAVGPGGVLSGRRARRVEQALLRDDHVRPLRVLAAPDGRLAADDLLERSADVDGAGALALGRAPGDRAARAQSPS